MSMTYRQACKHRIAEFENLRIKHKRFDEVMQQALHKILDSSTKIINIVGPTGVGKSMFIRQLEVAVVNAMCAEMAADPNMAPFITTTAVSEGHHGFDWKVFYQEALVELRDAFARLPSAHAAARRPFETLLPLNGRKMSTTAALRGRLELELKRHGTVVWCVDETQHILKVKSGPPKAQLEVLKSIAQRGHSKLCLVGPPNLKNLLYCSGELSRRSATILFPRYRHQCEEDLLQFASVAESFFKAMRIKSTPNVKSNLDLLYNGSLGCIGILKDWCRDALSSAVSRYESLDDVCVTLDDLRQTVLDELGLQTIQEEIQCFERSIEGGDIETKLDEIVHGSGKPQAVRASARKTTRLPAAGNSPSIALNGNLSAQDRQRVQELIDAGILRLPKEASPGSKRQPGIRKPGRDLVGSPELWRS